MLIKLNFNKQDFREIYFRNNNGHWLLNQTTKKSVIYLSIAGSCFLLALYIPHQYGFILTLTFIVCLALTLDFILKLQNYFKWRKRIERYLNTIAKHSKYELEVSSHSFTLALDDEITIERFNQFKFAEFKTDFISLRGNTTYLIPKKSMTEQEFEKLTMILKDKIQHAYFEKTATTNLTEDKTNEYN